jgi:hypothetical protein
MQALDRPINARKGFPNRVKQIRNQHHERGGETTLAIFFAFG